MEFLFMLACFLVGVVCGQLWRTIKKPKYSVGDFVCVDKKVYEIEQVRIVCKKGCYSEEPMPFYSQYYLNSGAVVVDANIERKLSKVEYAIYNTVLSEYADKGKV